MAARDVSRRDVPATVADAVLSSRRRFADAGIASPDLDARILVGHALGLDGAAMIVESRRALSTAESGRIAALVDRRLAREPVGRILGRREFWGLDFRLGAATLEPRPDSETVVEGALAFAAAAAHAGAGLRIADLGTGSGCLLVALLSALPQAIGIGIDISEAALKVARDNAEANGVASRATFLASDWTACLSGGFDVIVANPPYIPSKDCAGLAREVVEHDPAGALDGGSDGLAAYRAILGDAGRVLRPSGGLVVELGIGQRDAVAALAGGRGLVIAGCHTDLNGIDRALVLTRIGA